MLKGSACNILPKILLPGLGWSRGRVRRRLVSLPVLFCPLRRILHCPPQKFLHLWNTLQTKLDLHRSLESNLLMMSVFLISIASLGYWGYYYILGWNVRGEIYGGWMILKYECHCLDNQNKIIFVTERALCLFCPSFDDRPLAQRAWWTQLTGIYKTSFFWTL